MLRIAIVDDHKIVRAGFRDMLAEELDLSIAFEAGSGEEAIEQLRAQPVDVLLLDLSLPGQSGVDVLKHVKQRHQALRVLMLSGFPEERYALAMIRNGADGYLCKDCDAEELVRAIRTVAQGRRHLSARTAELLAEELTGGNTGPAHEQLSERELQVFLRLARGESVSEIGNNLHLSVKTISTYRSRLLEKLGVSSNAELAAYAIRNGLLVE
ncbi:MAG: response regulator transcription factor [Thauera phenolivorans]|uniref:Response regulator transcription factor n=1 Tax=Thauera phenolivorans TaxID=1792543 RepID=A0A7X7LWQ9_9RHOO|nr:response regulator transcription factor [Thauera phenolivorans]NLF54826.1 response regulator transcription factor [Thauera phenolivorans]